MLVVNKPFRHNGREVAPGESAPTDLGPKLTNQLVRQKTLIENDPAPVYGVPDTDRRVREAEVAFRKALAVKDTSARQRAQTARA